LPLAATLGRNSVEIQETLEISTTCSGDAFPDLANSRVFELAWASGVPVMSRALRIMKLAIIGTVMGPNLLRNFAEIEGLKLPGASISALNAAAWPETLSHRQSHG